ncbi:hypothetical protein [Stenotrophomonas sp. S39]|uniref:hypothetical protein n=1 Tax=Stenotrophomonas sp. S39 TaxID=2767451 RepID=UPI001F1FB38E|nr:hypothetical protein [Stenotrophomonas sp. S39]
MDLALLEFTQISTGEVLEQLFVIAGTEAATCHPVAKGVVSRIRLYAPIDEGQSGVSRSVRVQLERAALSALTQLGNGSVGGLHDNCTQLAALWHDGHLQELHSSSLTDSLLVLKRQTDLGNHTVLIDMSTRQPAGLTIERTLDQLKQRLRDGLAEGLHSYRTSQGDKRDRAASVGEALQPIETLTPAQQIALDACSKREALAEEWPSADQVSATLGPQPGRGGLLATELRRAGKLLAVYVEVPEPSYRFPTWQFRPDGQPIEQLAEILTVLRGALPFLCEPDGLRRTTGWGEVEWFLSPHVLLDGDVPASTLGTDPVRVLHAARTEFETGA